jgi:Zn-dependent protease
MAVAGPAANLMIVLLCAVFVRVGIAFGTFVSPDSANFHRIVEAHGDGVWSAIAFMVSVLFSLNLMMACLNLIPLPPLDGSAAVVLGLNEDTARGYQHYLMSSHGLGMIGLLIAWQVFDVIYDPIFTIALNLLYPGASYG